MAGDLRYLVSTCASSPSSSGWATWRCAPSSSAPTSRSWPHRLRRGTSCAPSSTSWCVDHYQQLLRAWATQDLTLATELVEHRPELTTIHERLELRRLDGLDAASASPWTCSSPARPPIASPTTPPSSAPVSAICSPARPVTCPQKSAVKRAPGGTLVGMKLLVTNDDGISSPGLPCPRPGFPVQDGRGCGGGRPRPRHERLRGGHRPHPSRRAHRRPPRRAAGPRRCPGLRRGRTARPVRVGGPAGRLRRAARPGGAASTPAATRAGPLHSGTWGGATAANFGGRGLAVSLDVPARLEQAVPRHWDTAAAVAAAAVGWLVEAGPGVVLNLNVPDLPPERLAVPGPPRSHRSAPSVPRVVETAEGGGRLQMELRPVNVELPPDCDTALVKEGYVAVSAIERHPDPGSTSATCWERWCRTPGGRHGQRIPQGERGAWAIGGNSGPGRLEAVRAPW